jgi:hypothetical protein
MADFLLGAVSREDLPVPSMLLGPSSATSPKDLEEIDMKTVELKVIFGDTRP